MVICLERGADCLHMVQLMPLHPKTPSSLASFKSRLVLPFWYQLTQVVVEKRPLNGYSSGVVVAVYVPRHRRVWCNVMVCDGTAKCIDQYVRLRVANADGNDEPVRMDPRLEGVVEKMFDRCIRDRQFKQVLQVGGVA